MTLIHSLSRLLPVGIAAAMLVMPDLAWAGGTHRFNLGTFDAFDEGETKGAAIESSGKVSVGYLPVRGEVDGSSVFSCVGGASSAYVGTAGGATIQRLSMTGKKRAPKADLLAKLPGVVVSAMLKLKSGAILAATLPGGQIYKVSKKGKVSKFAQLKVEAIWALGVHKGRVVAATGPRGEVYSMTFAGKGAKVIFDAPEKNVLSMQRVGKRLIVGTASKARVYEVTGDGDGVLLKEFTGDEVRALSLTRDGLVAVVNDFATRGTSSLDTMIRQLDRASVSASPPVDHDVTARTPKSDASVYFVELGRQRDLARAGEATWERWLHRKKQYFTDIVTLADRRTVLVSSSAGAKIYRVRGIRDVATVADLEERRATGLCKLKGGDVLATTGDGAAVYRLNARPAKKAKYITEVFDADQPATFGAILVRGSGDLRVRARSGATDEPDARWGAWRSVGLRAKGDGRRGMLNLPLRRYIQLEVVLAESGSELRDLTVFYAPQNLAPLLTQVNIDTPSFDLDDDDEPKAETTIKWKADARDDDELIYDVRIRPTGSKEEEWLRLNEDEPVTETEFTLDLNTIPDGTYEIAVSVSDEPTNGSRRARTDELRSQPFVVDRTRPVLSAVVIKGTKVTGVATDVGSYVHDVAYSVDGKAFHSGGPVDGLFDNGREKFEFQFPKLGPGAHRLVIRARDASGNLVTKAFRLSPASR
ncbi:MAG: hypothetical protein V3V08_25625 [Nannocystaceae bacterium]